MVHRLHRPVRADGFQWFMARCDSCFGIITKTDSACYVCGEPVSRERSKTTFSVLGRVQLAGVPGRWQSMDRKTKLIQLSIDALLVTSVIGSVAAAIFPSLHK